MKTNRYFSLLLLLGCLFGAASCQDEATDLPSGPQPETEANLQLSGENTNAVFVDSRATQEPYFPANTHYRIWMDGLVPGSNPEQMKNRFCAVGHDVVESGVHYIKFSSFPQTNPTLNAAPLKFNDASDKLDFYGLTDPSQQHTEIGDNQAYLNYIQTYLPKDDNRTDEAPIYILKRLPQQGSTSVTETDTLVDVRHAVKKGCTRQNTGLILPLPFKHILSKVNFEIVQQVNKDATTSNTPMYPDLYIEGVKVIGQPQEGTFDIKQGKFMALGTVTGPDYRVKNLLEEKNDKLITTRPKKIGHALLFPMIAEPTQPMQVVVTLKGNQNTLQPFAQDRAAVIAAGDGSGLYLLDLTLSVYSNNPSQDPNQAQNKPLRLDPNYEYDIQFMIMNNDVRIVTIVPQVYPWIDGEKGANDPVYGWHEEQDMGQPVTFNGVVWSDRNLGASSANPLRSKEDWLKSVGYYYQFDRNIPYFPNSYDWDSKYKGYRINLETSLATALSEKSNKRPLYPVVNFDVWPGYYPDDWQLKPHRDDYTYINTIGEETNNRQNLSWGLALRTDKGQPNLWQTPATQPCPKGWKLPTREDFMGIMPGTAYSGNITFRDLQIKQDGSYSPGRSDDERKKEHDFPVRFGKGGTGLNHNNPENSQPYLPPMIDSNGNHRSYLGTFPCLFREEENDPQQGSKSQYVLSMKGDDWKRVIDSSGKLQNADFVYNWGTIYGIKHVGTSKAYRLRWQVLIAGSPTVVSDLNLEKYKQHCSNPNTTMYEGKSGLSYEGLYGVLVISRYTATQSDSFEADANGSYEWVADKKDWWANPVEELYLPICGVAGSWKDGALYNIGSEGWYATSEFGSNDANKGMVWLKYSGDGSANQVFIYSNESPKYDVVNVRCVRDN